MNDISCPGSFSSFACFLGSNSPTQQEAALGEKHSGRLPGGQGNTVLDQMSEERITILVAFTPLLPSVFKISPQGGPLDLKNAY